LKLFIKRCCMFISLESNWTTSIYLFNNGCEWFYIARRKKDDSKYVSFFDEKQNFNRIYLDNQLLNIENNSGQFENLFLVFLDHHRTFFSMIRFDSSLWWTFSNPLLQLNFLFVMLLPEEMLNYIYNPWCSLIYFRVNMLMLMYLNTLLNQY